MENSMDKELGSTRNEASRDQDIDALQSFSVSLLDNTMGESSQSKESGAPCARSRNS